MLYGATARKSILALIDQAVVSGTNFLTTVMVGRMCGLDELGIYSLGFGIVVLITNVQESLISVPYTIYGNRLQPESRAEYAGSILVHYGMLSALAMLCLVLFSVVLTKGVGPAGLAPVIWLLAGIIPFTLLREFGRRFAFAHLHMATALLLDIAVAMMQIGGLVWLAANGDLTSVTTYAVVGLACAAAGLPWLVLARAKIVLRWEQVTRELRRSLSFGKWVFASQITGTVHAYLLYWLLALLLDTTTTGAFAACWTVVMIANPFLLGISNVLSARAARAFAEGGRAEVRRVIYKTTLVLGSAMAAFCWLVFLFGGEMMRLLYGREYAGYEHTISVLAIAMLVSALLIAVDHGLKVMERPNMNFKASLMGLGVTLMAAPYLVVQWNVLGAACGFLVGALVALAVRWMAFLRLVGGISWRGDRV